MEETYFLQGECRDGLWQAIRCCRCFTAEYVEGESEDEFAYEEVSPCVLQR